MLGVEVRVDGHWLALESLYGDVEMSTVWPGGSDELAWTMAQTPRPMPGGTPVQGYVGGVPVWSGTLVEPDLSQQQLVAQGLWRLAEQFEALDAVGNATTVPDTAIDQAIVRGLNWIRPVSVSTTAVDLDTAQGPVTLAALLDAWSDQSAQRWGVDPCGQVETKTDDTKPSYQVFGIEDSLGYALDGYASTLIGRYRTATGFATAIRTDSQAEALHGHLEILVDLTPKGVLTATKANTILDNLLAFGRATPQWTSNLAVSYGELLTLGGTPVALETVAAGTVVRIHGGLDLAWRRNGQMYVDVPIGRTHLLSGDLQLEPRGAAARTLTDVLAAALAR